MKIDPRLKTWASERQGEHIDAVIQHGSQAKAAKALGINLRNLEKSIALLRRSAALRGYSPEHDYTHPVPDTHVAKGVSTYYDADGKVRGQWVKSSLDDAKAEEARRAVLDALSEEVRGMAPLVQGPVTSNDQLMAVYPLGDPHFGMYAWAKETGEAFDLDEAERLTFGAVDSLVGSAPAADIGIVLPLGDVFHANDQSNQTPAHKHQLDVDSRYPKVIQSGIKTFRRAILRALEKHRKVIVRIEQGNHDPEAKWALAFALAAYFENEPRVEIDLTPGKFWYYRFGKVLLGTTHGDTVKQAQLGGVMAADRPEDWGLTKHRYFLSGHVHSSNVLELPGVVCESFRTLAASDAYAAGHGYRAGRDMRLIVMHREFGEVARHRCDVSMIGE
jgi:DNA-binding XRE family transcriptional regulator